MEKYLVNPKDTNAFSSQDMHKVILNNIDFELPDHIWDEIDDGFGSYWNVEVGYGSRPDLNSAVTSISRWLQKKHIVFSIEKIATIVNIMFDWIEQIPGAILDEDVVVIPRSFEEIEKERRFMKHFEKHIKERIRPNFNDAMTDYVYISNKLKDFYPGTFKRLTKLFKEMEIEWGEVKRTKDIWIRDYMPIQISDEQFLVYHYNPDYLKDTGEKYLTNSQTIFKSVLRDSQWENIGIKLDGGNVIPCDNYYILTNKVFSENNKEKDDTDFKSFLAEKFKSKLIILPWHCDNSDEPNADVYGHADGFVRWVGDNRVLMSNHRETNPDEASEIKWRLHKEGFEVTEMLFDVPHPNKDFNWAYINYLQVGNKIIVPTFGILEDKQAIKYIQEANPACTVRGFRMRHIARNGGALHCITWNINKS